MKILLSVGLRKKKSSSRFLMGGYTLVRKAFTRKFSGRGGKVLRNVCSPFASRFTSVRISVCSALSLFLSLSFSLSPPMTAFSVFLLGRKGRWNRRRLLISVRFNVILVSSSSCDVCACNAYSPR